MKILLERETEPMVIGSKSVGMKIEDGGGDHFAGYDKSIHQRVLHAVATGGKALSLNAAIV